MKKVFILLFISTFIVLLIGCNDNTDKNMNILFNGIMINSGLVGAAQTTNYFKDSFLSNNKVSGASYKNNDFDPSNPESEKYIYDSDSPKEIIIVIDSIEMHNQVFNSTHEVDYDREILILRLFASTNCSYSLDKVILENNILKIYYNSIVNVTTDPEQAFILIKIDKIEYETVEFIRKKRAR